MCEYGKEKNIVTKHPAVDLVRASHQHSLS